jgi:hypothetical protein
MGAPYTSVNRPLVQRHFPQAIQPSFKMMVSITKYIQEDSKFKKSVIAYEHQVVAAGTILGVDHCLLGLTRVTNNTALSRIQN